MPTDPNLFPLLPSSGYGPDQLHGYLASLVSQGYVVYRDPQHENVFYIVLSDTHRIRISVSEGRSQVQLHYLGNLRGFLDVTSLPDLERAVAQFGTSIVGSMWPARPTSGRLRPETPATNYRTISCLINASRVVAIFDPYLDNKTLEELRIVLSFGAGTVSDNGIRILGGIKNARGETPTLTAAGVQAWLKQQGISGEARAFPPKTEHRRFLLLDDGRTLITGHSLNAPHKNEVVHVETSSEDRAFFESTWAVSEPL